MKCRLGDDDNVSYKVNIKGGKISVFWEAKIHTSVVIEIFLINTETNKELSICKTGRKEGSIEVWDHELGWKKGVFISVMLTWRVALTDDIMQIIENEQLTGAKEDLYKH